jgi:hypothetical protein
MLVWIKTIWSFLGAWLVDKRDALSWVCRWLWPTVQRLRRVVLGCAWANQRMLLLTKMDESARIKDLTFDQIEEYVDNAKGVTALALIR